MKKWLLLVGTVLLLMGCATPAQRADFKKHDTMYASWEHLKFSIHGYKNPTLKDADKSDTEGWWGEPIDVPYGVK
ncbi:MAG: hypothetical protein JRI77_04270 [Deltaproteobacteria bacterium]|nr:hypothetical protein [Deltaproteobacteria bacterium]